MRGHSTFRRVPLSGLQFLLHLLQLSSRLQVSSKEGCSRHKELYPKLVPKHSKGEKRKDTCPLSKPPICPSRAQLIHSQAQAHTQPASARPNGHELPLPLSYHVGLDAAGCSPGSSFSLRPSEETEKAA